jgi:hypothetical protein
MISFEGVLEADGRVKHLAPLGEIHPKNHIATTRNSSDSNIILCFRHRNPRGYSF